MMSLHARRHRAIFWLSVSFIAVVVVLLPRAAHADLIQYSFAGTVELIGSDVTSPSVSLGDPWSATFFIDAATAEVNSIDPNTGSYRGLTGSLSFGAHTVTDDHPGFLLGAVTIGLPGSLELSFRYFTGTVIDGLPIHEMSLQLFHTSSIVFSFGSDALAETVPLNLDDFDNEVLDNRVAIISATGYDYIFGITSASSQLIPTSVPEPGTAALLGLALSAVAVMGRVVVKRSR